MDMGYIEKTVNIEAAAQYIRRRISENGLALTRTLGEECSWESGMARTFCPADVELSTLTDLVDGGRMGLGPPTEWLAGQIAAFLSGGDDRVCILEDTCSRPDDAWLKSQTDVSVAVYGVQVYQMIPAGRGEPNIIAHTLGTADSAWGLIGVMTTDPNLQDTSPRRVDVGPETIRTWAAGAKAVILSAYDGEGWIVWRRS